VGSSQRLLRLEGTAVLLAKREQRERGGGREGDRRRNGKIDKNKQQTQT